MGALLCGERQRVHRAEDERRTVVEQPSGGRLLIFVNPNSGSGKGVRTFRQKVYPELVRNGMSYEMVTTSGPQHAERTVRERTDLGRFSALLVLSGDGLVFEVLNGLCARADRDRILPSLPIGIVPSGSGNGLLASVFASTKLPLRGNAFMDKAVGIATSQSSVAVPVNLLHVETDGEDVAAFLSIGWGLLADIDIESERWRKSLGSNRFLAGALVRILYLRSYRGLLSFLPYSGPSTSTGVSSYAAHAKTASERMGECPSSAEGRPASAPWSSSHLPGGVPPLADPLPQDGWTAIEDDFVFVYALSLSHISTEGPLMPPARLADDRIHLTYALRSEVTKMGLFKFLTAIENENHMEFPFFKTVEVSSFRLEPIDAGSYITVDGEALPTSRVQATVTRHCTVILSEPESV